MASLLCKLLLSEDSCALMCKYILIFFVCLFQLIPPLPAKMGARDEGAFRNPVEGPAMLSIGIVGTLLNLLCLCALRRTRELKLSPDYLFLLRLQSTFDLAYLVMSTPVTALPYAFPSFRTYYEPHVLPYVFPFVQVGTATNTLWIDGLIQCCQLAYSIANKCKLTTDFRFLSCILFTEELILCTVVFGMQNFVPQLIKL